MLFPPSSCLIFSCLKLMAHLLFDVAMMGLGDLDRIFFFIACKKKNRAEHMRMMNPSGFCV